MKAAVCGAARHLDTSAVTSGQSAFRVSGPQPRATRGAARDRLRFLLSEGGHSPPERVKQQVWERVPGGRPGHPGALGPVSPELRSLLDQLMPILSYILKNKPAGKG